MWWMSIISPALGAFTVRRTSTAWARVRTPAMGTNSRFTVMPSSAATWQISANFAR